MFNIPPVPEDSGPIEYSLKPSTGVLSLDFSLEGQQKKTEFNQVNSCSYCMY